MSLQDKITELTAQIKEKEDAENRLITEACILREERDILVGQLIQNENILADTNWEFKLSNGTRFYLESRDSFSGKIGPIVKLFTCYNSQFDRFDLEGGIRLQFDSLNDYISISFEEPKQLMPFVKRNKMLITGTGIIDRLAKLKREVSSLEEVCHTFEITK